MRALVVTLLTLAALALAPVAHAAIPDFGPAPWKCGGGVYYGPSGCYAYDSGPGAMDDGNTLELDLSPHIVHPGGTLTATMTTLPGAGYAWPPNVSGLTQIGVCAPNTPTCSYQATGLGHTQWQKFSMSCCGAIEQDYYAVLGEGFSIDGTVKDRTPAGLVSAPNEQVTINGSGGSFTATTNLLGVYQRNVPAGTYTVRTARRHCASAQLPQCVTSKQVTVGPDATADFEQPSDVRIEGTVKDAEDAPVKGVTIRADDPAGGRLKTAVSGANGRYEMVVRAGAVLLSADDPEACVVSAGSCPKTRDLDVSRDTTVDWKVEGCVKKVDFGSSMIAVNGCFTKVDDDKWETEKSFRMNGIDVYPGDKVTLDKTAQEIVFGPLRLELYGVTWVQLPSLVLHFASAKETIQNDKFKFKGVEIPSGTVKLDWEAGKSTLSIAATIPAAFGNPAQSSGENACPGQSKITLTFVTTNDDGLRQVGLAADDAQAGFCIGGKAASRTESPGAVGAGSPSAGLRVEGVRGSYDLVSNWWVLGAKLSGLPSIGGKVTVDGEVTLDQDFWPRRFAVKVDSINKPIKPPELFWQRVDMNVGNDAPNTPFKIGFGAGFSLFAKNPSPQKKSLPLLGEVTVIPSELAALDGSFTVALAPGAASVADVGLEGSGTLKVWDYTFITGKLSYIGTSSSFLFDGRVGLSTPNGQFALDGRASGFWDVSRGLLFAEGNANVRIPGLRALAADVVVNAKKGVLAACASVPLIGDPARNRFGIVYTFSEGLSPVGGCDISRFRETPPKALGAATGRSFTVLPGTKLLLIEVKGAKGAGAPAFDLAGPGTRIAVTGRGVQRGPLIAIPVAGSDATYLVLRRPRPGRWSLVPRSRSVISDIRFAGPLPEARVSGSVGGKACSPVLRWSAKPLPDQRLTIVDTGARGDRRVLVAAAKSRGSVKVPSLESAGLRTAQALVFNGETLRATIPLGSYSSPGAAPAAPRGLAVREGKLGRLVVRWRPACGSQRHAVVVGRGKEKLVRGSSITLAAPAGKAPTVTVTSIGAGGTRGGSAQRALAASAG